LIDIIGVLVVYKHVDVDSYQHQRQGYGDEDEKPVEALWQGHDCCSARQGAAADDDDHVAALTGTMVGMLGVKLTIEVGNANTDAWLDSQPGSGQAAVGPLKCDRFDCRLLAFAAGKNEMFLQQLLQYIQHRMPMWQPRDRDSHAVDHQCSLQACEPTERLIQATLPSIMSQSWYGCITSTWACQLLWQQSTTTLQRQTSAARSPTGCKQLCLAQALLVPSLPAH
jgi:hypothetical protein